MFKWIRWPGLIAFVVIVGGFTVLMMLFASTFLKGTVEHFGSKALGAKLELSSVNLSVDPLGFRIGRIQATNPDAPMTNAVEIEGVAFEVAFWNLWMGQFVINELSVDGMQFNTPREYSGALPKKTKAEIAKEAEPTIVDDVAEELPSADELLARESLLTEQRSEELQMLYEERTTQIDTLSGSLMTSEQLQAYKDEVKTLTSSKLKSLDDFQQRRKRLSEINTKLKNEKNKVVAIKDAYRSAYKDLNEKLKELKAAPSEDLKNLKSKYRLDGAGVTNLSYLLFGPQASQWTSQTLKWYEKAKPYLASGEEEEKPKVIRKKGRYVYFGGIEAIPEFLLREARIDVQLAAGHLDGKLVDLTHQPEILGRPSILTVNGNELVGYDAINFSAEFNHVDPENSFDKATLNITEMQVKDFSVSDDSSFALKLASAQTNVMGTALVKNKVLDLDMDSYFTQVQFESEASSGAAKQVGELLEDIHQFTIDIKADGKIKDLDTSIDSSLDKELKLALDRKIDSKQAELEAELKAKLDEKIDEKAGKYSEDLKALLKGGDSFDAKQKELESLAKSKLSSWKDQQKAELDAKKAEEKAKLKAKKKAKEEAAKKKAKDALKEKLKGFSF